MEVVDIIMGHMAVQLLVGAVVLLVLTRHQAPEAHNQPVVHNPVVVQAQHFKVVQVVMDPMGVTALSAVAAAVAAIMEAPVVVGI